MTEIDETRPDEGEGPNRRSLFWPLVALAVIVVAIIVGVVSCSGSSPKTAGTTPTTTATTTTPTTPNTAQTDTTTMATSTTATSPTATTPGTDQEQPPGTPESASGATTSGLQVSGPVTDGSWTHFAFTIVGGKGDNQTGCMVAFFRSENWNNENTSWFPADQLDIVDPAMGSRTYGDLPTERHWLNIGDIQPGKKINVNGWVWASARQVAQDGSWPSSFYMGAQVDCRSSGAPAPTKWKMFNASALYVVQG